MKQVKVKTLADLHKMPSKEQKRFFKVVVKSANKMQRDLVSKPSKACS